MEELRAFVIEKFQETADRTQRLEDDLAEHKDTIAGHLNDLAKDHDVFATIRHHVTEQQLDDRLKFFDDQFSALQVKLM